MFVIRDATITQILAAPYVTNKEKILATMKNLNFAKDERQLVSDKIDSLGEAAGKVFTITDLKDVTDAGKWRST